jgi:hypothetical protein
MANPNLSSLYSNILSNAPKDYARGARQETMEVAEVVDVILDENHEFANDDPTNIGMVQVRRVISDKNKKQSELGWCRPLWPNGQSIPLIHEMVIAIMGPKNSSGINYAATRPYYIGPIGIWGLENYNPLPGTGVDLSVLADLDSNAKKYASFTGNSNPGETVSEDLEFGKTFEAKPGVQRARPFEGDRLFEGRWGQSFRFTSKIAEGEPSAFHPNTWSTRGASGDPLIIIRNGEADDADPEKSFVEDINKDPSSIWITSTQLINLDLASWNFKSYGMALEGSEFCAQKAGDNPETYVPKMPNNYGGDDKAQLLIKSDRVIIQAGEGRDKEVGDSIFLNAKKSISLSGKGSIHLDSDGPVIVNSGDQIHLGLGSLEPAVLGDQLTNFMTEFLTGLMAGDLATPVGIGLFGPGAQQTFSDLLAKLQPEAPGNFLCKKVKVE